MDAINDWPARGQLLLEGLTFGRLGGIYGDTGPQMHDQEAKWWDNWARRDPNYSPATYAQLAAAFTNSGDRDTADDIRYLRREREREMVCKESWLSSSCILQRVLGSVAGYGIGSHTFNVIPCIVRAALRGWGVRVHCLDNIRPFHDRLTQASSHCRGNAQSLVDAYPIIPNGIDRDHVRMVFKFL
jgi:hypothetical protein